VLQLLLDAKRKIVSALPQIMKIVKKYDRRLRCQSTYCQLMSVQKGSYIFCLKTSTNEVMLTMFDIRTASNDVVITNKLVLMKVTNRLTI